MSNFQNPLNSYGDVRHHLTDGITRSHGGRSDREIEELNTELQRVGVSHHTMRYVMKQKDPLGTLRQVNIARVSKGKGEIPFNIFDSYLTFYIESQDVSSLLHQDEKLHPSIIKAQIAKRKLLKQETKILREVNARLREELRSQPNSSKFWSEDFVNARLANLRDDTLTERRGRNQRKKNNKRQHAVEGNEKMTFGEILTKIVQILNPVGEHPRMMEVISPFILTIYSLTRSKNVIDVYVALYHLRTLRFTIDSTLPTNLDFSMRSAVEIYAWLNHDVSFSNREAAFIRATRDLLDEYGDPKDCQIRLKSDNTIVLKGTKEIEYKAELCNCGMLDDPHPYSACDVEVTYENPESKEMSMDEEIRKRLSKPSPLCVCGKGGSHLMKTCPNFLKMMGIRRVPTQVEELNIEENKEVTSFLDKYSVSIDLVKAFFNKVISNELFNNLKNMILAIASFKWFGKDVSKTIMMWFGVTKSLTIADLILSILDMLHVMFKCGLQLLHGVPMSQILMGTNPVSDYLSKANLLLSFTDKIYSGVPVKGMKSRTNYIMEAHQLILIGDELVKTLNPMLATTADVKAKLNALKTNVLHEESADMAQRRTPPFSIILHGDPGVGKSVLFPVICDLWSRCMDREFDMSHVYHRIGTTDFWDGYQPRSHKILHYSEVGNMQEKILQSRGDPMVMEACQVADSLPMLLNMAFEKAKTWLDVELVITDTNTPDLGLKYMVTNPSAVQRRQLFIEQIVKPKYRVKGGVGIDIKKSMESEEDILDRWTFNVYRMIPKDNLTCTKHYLLRDTDPKSNIYSFLEILRKEYMKHIVVQNHIREKMNRVDTTKYFGESMRRENADGVITLKNYYELAEEGDKEAKEILKTIGELPSHLEDIVEEKKEVPPPKQSRWRVKRSDSDSKEENKSNIPIPTQSNTLTLTRLHKWNFADFIMFCRMVTWAFVVMSVTYFIIEYINALNIRNDKRYYVILSILCIVNLITFLRLGYGLEFYFTSFLFGLVILRTIIIFFIKGKILMFLRLQYDIKVKRLRYLFSGKEDGDHLCSDEYIYHKTFFRKYYPYILGTLAALGGITYIVYKYAYKPEERNRQYIQKEISRYFAQNHIAPVKIEPEVIVEEKVNESVLDQGVRIVNEWQDNCNDDSKVIVDAVSTSTQVPQPTNRSDEEHFRMLGVTPQSNLDWFETSNLGMVGDIDSMDGFTRYKNKLTEQTWTTRENYVVNGPHKGTLESLYKNLSSSIRHVLIELGNDRANGTYVLGLCSNIALINTHALPKKTDFKVYVAQAGCRLNDTDCANVTCVIWKGDKYDKVIDLGNDQSLIQLSGVQFADKLKHVVSNRLPDGAYEAINMKGRPAIVVKSSVGVEFIDDKIGPFPVAETLQYWNDEAKKGDCGKPVLIKAGKSVLIAGIHTGSLEKMSYATVLNSTVLQAGITKFGTNFIRSLPDKNRPIAECSTFVRVSEKFLCEQPHRKSFVHYENMDRLRFVGVIPYSSNKGRSNINKTAYYDDVIENVIPTIDPEFKDNMGAPLMGPRTIKDEYVNPFNKAIRSLNLMRRGARSDILQRCVREFSTRIINGLREKGHTTRWKPFTLKTAINGFEDDDYVKCINMSTAAGFGFQGLKSKYFTKLSAEGERNMYAPSKEVLESVNAKLKIYAEGGSCGIVYNGSLKDEAREIEKCKSGDTRMFFASAVDDLIISRMFLGPLYSTLQQHPNIFGSGIGLDYTKDVSAFISNFDRFSNPFNIPNITEGDFKKFDRSMSFDIGLAANQVIREVFVAMGYNEFHMRILDGLLSDSLFPIVHICGILLIIAGLQPSGKYGTAEDNSIRNVLLHMYIWYVIVTIKGPSYFLHNEPATFGDDVINCTDPQYVNIFNNFILRDKFLEVFGMVYTPAAKSGSMQKMLRVDQMSFLKRTFIEENGRWATKLSTDSICKSLLWTLVSDVPESVQAVGAIRSALIELCTILTKVQHDVVRIALHDIYFKYYQHAVDLTPFSYNACRELRLLA